MIHGVARSTGRATTEHRHHDKERTHMTTDNTDLAEVNASRQAWAIEAMDLDIALDAAQAEIDKLKAELTAFVRVSLEPLDYTTDAESTGWDDTEYERARANITEMHRVLNVRQERLFDANDDRDRLRAELDQLRERAHAVLAGCAAVTDPSVGWAGWPEEYGALAETCGYTPPESWRTSTALVPTGRVTVCCPSRHPADCCDPDDCGPCCPECPTCPTVQAWTPDKRAEAAARMRQERTR